MNVILTSFSLVQVPYLGWFLESSLPDAGGHRSFRSLARLLALKWWWTTVTRCNGSKEDMCTYIWLLLYLLITAACLDSMATSTSHMRHNGLLIHEVIAPSRKVLLLCASSSSVGDDTLRTTTKWSDFFYSLHSPTHATYPFQPDYKSNNQEIEFGCCNPLAHLA